jgi:hypothetical protein
MAWWLWGLGAVGLAGAGYYLVSGEEKHHGHGGRGARDPNAGTATGAATDPTSAAQPADQGVGDTPPAATLPQESDPTPAQVPGSPAPSTPVTGGFHPGPYLLPQAVDALRGRGRALPAARRLYTALSQQGTGGDSARGLVRPAVLQFQRSHNSDPVAIRLAGRLPNTGYYDQRTSATLTMYTGLPIPAGDSAPPPPPPQLHHIVNPNIPGNAAMAGYNLGVDLARRGVVHDPRQRQLIKHYQQQINRDPKFPGPAWSRPTQPILRNRIRENGRYNVETARALALQTHGAPPPPV